MRWLWGDIESLSVSVTDDVRASDRHWTACQQQSNGLLPTHLQMNHGTDVNFLREKIWSENLRSEASPGFLSTFSGAQYVSTWHGAVVGQSSLNKAVALCRDLIPLAITKTQRLSQKWERRFGMNCIQKQPSVKPALNKHWATLVHLWWGEADVDCNSRQTNVRWPHISLSLRDEVSSRRRLPPLWVM